MIDLTKPIEISTGKRRPWIPAEVVSKCIATDYEGRQKIQVRYDHPFKGDWVSEVYLEPLKGQHFHVRNVPDKIRGFVNIYRSNIHPTKEAATLAASKYLGTGACVATIELDAYL